MKIARIVSCASVAVALVAGLSFARRASGADDEASLVRKRCGALVAAWNQHDPKAMAAAFTEDGDIINPMGQHAAGRADIEKLFAAEQTGGGMMRESMLEVKTEPLRFLTADVAISDAEVEISNVIGPDGKKMGPVPAHVTNVWKKIGGEWWVAASRPYLKTAPK
jgi:uncharacterized protein (TIGR02246 family)